MILVLMVARLLIRLKYPAPPIVPKPKPMITGLAPKPTECIYIIKGRHYEITCSRRLRSGSAAENC